MLSERGLYTASLLYSFPCFLKIIPFDWDSVNSRLTPLPSYRIGFSILHLVNILANTVFLIWSYHENQSALVMSPWRLLLHLMWLSTFLIALGYSTFTIICRHDLADLVNQIFIVIREECVRDEVPSLTSPDWCQRLLKLFMLTGKSFGVFGALIFFIDPYSSRYFYDTFCRVLGINGVWVYILFGLWQFMNATVFWESILFHVATVLLFIFGTATWFKASRFRRRDGTLTTPRTQLHSYKKLKLLSIQFNTCFRYTMIPTLQILGILLPVLCFHVIISFHDGLSPIILSCLLMVSLTSLTFTIFSWPVAAELHTKSLKFLRILKMETQRKEVKKDVRSMRSIRIECGNINFVQRYTTYKLLGMIVYGTGKSLLILKH